MRGQEKATQSSTIRINTHKKTETEYAKDNIKKYQHIHKTITYNEQIIKRERQNPTKNLILKLIARQGQH